MSQDSLREIADRVQAPTAQPAASATDADTTLQADPAAIEAALARLRSGQRFIPGLLAGLLAAVVGAVLWAAVTVATGYQIGWMAVGVGALVGVAMRVAGRGVDRAFGIAGAVLALLGCLAGNVLIIAWLLGDAAGVGLGEALAQMDVATTIELLKLSFSGMDLLFYGLALAAGFQLAQRKLAPEDLAPDAAAAGARA